MIDKEHLTECLHYMKVVLWVARRRFRSKPQVFNLEPEYVPVAD